MDPGWIVDQIAFLIISIILLILFILQFIRLRRREPHQDPPIVRFLCHLGVGFGILQTLRGIDPSGVNGIYSPEFVSCLANEIGCLLFTGFAYLNYLTLTFNYRLSQATEPVPQSLKYIFCAVVICQWVLANLCSLLLWVTKSQLFGYGIFLFWVGGVAMPWALITLDVAIVRLKGFLYQSALERAQMMRQQMIVNRENYGSIDAAGSKKSLLPSSSMSTSIEDPEGIKFPYSYSTTSHQSNSSSSLGTSAPAPKYPRRPSISTTSVSISVSTSMPPSSHPSSPQKARSLSDTGPEVVPELTVTKSKALRKLLTLQLWSHVIGLIVIILSLAYAIKTAMNTQFDPPEAGKFNFWWTVFSHIENAFGAVMLWYCWRPLPHFYCCRSSSTTLWNLKLSLFQNQAPSPAVMASPTVPIQSSSMESALKSPPASRAFPKT